jgi:uncharacterized protein (TIGR03437 family)
LRGNNPKGSREGASVAKITLAVMACLAHGAQQPAAECGTTAGRVQEEMFLHARHVVGRAKAHATVPAASTNQDVGQIAVIDDSGGVVGRRNLFNLDNQTLIYQPVGSGYQIRMAGDSFDAAAASAGTQLAGLGDDDSRPVALPFGFLFFGSTFSQAWVNSNGLITFTGGDTDYSGSYGHFVSGLPAIAPLFADLDPSQSSAGVRVLTETGRVVVTWSNVPLAGSFGIANPPAQNFQVRLYADTHIEVAYHSINLPAGLVGITPGASAASTLLDFASVPSGIFGAVAETFASSDSVDLVFAAQKFYQTHDDAYDYLVFYNAEDVAAGPGVVAYELTTRSHGLGFGDTATEIGAQFGSPQRLKAVLNLGPVSQYPADPNAPVVARGPTGDTPLTILGHESGHLFLALVSVPDENGGTPMLGRGQVHWAFTFNSDASFLEGNRIADRGAGGSPRFTTTATVQHYSALDQYLMGFRAPEEVPGTFAVLNSVQALARPPQVGVGFDGAPLNISIDDIVNVAGRRTPDSTVAQRHYRFGIVVIVPEAADLASGSAADAVKQVDGYRAQFGSFFANATDGGAVAETSLRRGVTLSMAPSAGVVTGQNGFASIALARAAEAAVTFTLNTPNHVLSTPASVTIPAGASTVSFQTVGVRDGVEEFSAAPSDASYETAVARVQVGEAAGLSVSVAASSAGTVVLRIADRNSLAYSDVALSATWEGGGSSVDLLTDETGRAELSRPPGATSLLVKIAGQPVTLSVPLVPVVGAVVNAASYMPSIAPGSLATVFGSGLANGRVVVNGAAVVPFYSSASQLNFLAPANILPGNAQIQVTTAGGASDPAITAVAAHAPGIFGARQEGGVLEIYGTGLGVVDSTLNVQIAGRNASVLYAGPSSFPGLDQVNVQIPSGISGSQTLSLSIEGIASNTIPLLVNPAP